METERFSVCGECTIFFSLRPQKTAERRFPLFLHRENMRSPAKRVYGECGLPLFRDADTQRKRMIADLHYK